MGRTPLWQIALAFLSLGAYGWVIRVRRHHAEQGPLTNRDLQRLAISMAFWVIGVGGGILTLAAIMAVVQALIYPNETFLTDGQIQAIFPAAPIAWVLGTAGFWATYIPGFRTKQV